jgi:hypothetical protein
MNTRAFHSVRDGQFWFKQPRVDWDFSGLLSTRSGSTQQTKFEVMRAQKRENSKQNFRNAPQKYQGHL